MTTTETRAVTVGDKATEHTFGPLTITDIVRYAGASGDMNPLHHDEAAAKAAGFAGIFSIGMFQAGLLATFAANWLGAENVRRFTTRFKEQVWPGDTLTCTGEVTDVHAGDGGSTVEITLTCTRQTGGVAIDGSAEFWLPGPETAEIVRSYT
ncbi:MULTISPECIES: MaoC/PaaZ C-terminal domain-containing protein [Rhodococcus]|uniref:MaoC family dehydratase N-terminal domain-containing protein n=1 Tax=Rhodococcus pseudokoreensis TaxID=2811421 RepID=A0A974W227_9NOCA|nr:MULTISPECIES: MaoC/PaaZ C-terminal domain-containing protein [Rhodococcus]MBV6760731.1 MaoC family dehydratase N-terminal domain-containing protein [Rhodococcus opacus]QSE89863.1 MaoC family dehydratase N-terminal domain-containing protein [Rhodococcus pseudokoreensis]